MFNNNSKQNIILFDIDRTLLNTDRFVQKIKQLIVNKSQLSDVVVDKKFEKYKNSLASVFYFDFIDLLGTLNLERNIKSEIIKDYEENPEIYPSYSDVKPTLKYLKQKGVRMGIFSEGTPGFQKNKLNNLNLKKYIDENLVFIAQSKRLDDFIAKIPRGSYIVDDNPEIINHLIKYKHIKPIYLNRNSDKKCNFVFSGIVNIGSLDELRRFF